MTMRNALAVVAVVALGAVAGSGCTIRRSALRPDYEQVDRYRVKRLVIITQPQPEGSKAVGDLWSLIARRQVNLKRQFIAKETDSLAQPFDPKERCGEGLEGVLWLKPQVRREDGYLVASVDARLLRCSDGGTVWRAEGGGRWPLQDPGVKEITATYVQELGPEVAPHVPAAFNLIKALVDEMPDPVLTEEDKDEKIELGD
jgi:probable lipoprotein (TIGR04455 family)